MNIPILKQLWKQRRQSKPALKEGTGKLRLEFTIILISISACFILLNIPYLLVLCRNYLHFHRLHEWLMQAPSDLDRMSDQLYFCRTIFYMNYSIKFFMYLAAAAYYRREICYYSRLNAEVRLSEINYCINWN